MVTILQDKCRGCRACVDICHESCMALIDGKVDINFDFCSTCGQCIAICPEQALQWKDNRPQVFDHKQFPSSGQLDELFKQRRTNRYFKKQKPSRDLIGKIVDYGAYAPTHSHEFRIIAVDHPAHLEKIDHTAYAFNKKIYNVLYKPKFFKYFVKLVAPSQLNEYLKAKPKLEHSMKIQRGYDGIPPVLIFIAGPRRIPLSLESAQYILYNIDLFCRTVGLGCRILVGNQMFFNHSKTVRRLLQLDKAERIFATAGVGYPAGLFRNKVEGRRMRLDWSSDRHSVDAVQKK